MPQHVEAIETLPESPAAVLLDHRLQRGDRRRICLGDGHHGLGLLSAIEGGRRTSYGYTPRKSGVTKVENSRTLTRGNFHESIPCTDSQIVAVSKEAEGGTSVPELCCTHGISNATFYEWRSKFGGMDASLMLRMKELKDENRRLKKLYDDAPLSADLLREVSMLAEVAHCC